ncbi:MAG: DUF3303 family protein [Gemmatimonadota bacterium]|nr:DUF3303 family protein [Gemmatimonadota bacterium]
MKFMVSWQTHSDKVADVVGGWASTTRAQRADLGKGVKLIGRWHNMAAGNGVLIVETSNLAALNRYIGQWTPYMDIDVSPVMTDDESATVCKQIVKDAKG